MTCLTSFHAHERHGDISVNYTLVSDNILNGTSDSWYRAYYRDKFKSGDVLDELVTLLQRHSEELSIFLDKHECWV